MESFFTPRHSIAFSTGKCWYESRKRAFQALRELGYGKNRLEELINIESEYLIESMNSIKGPRNNDVVSRIFATATTNVICQLSFGMRYSYDQPELMSLFNSVKTFFDGSFLANLHIILPQTLRRAPLIYNQGVEDFVSAITTIRQFIRRNIRSQQQHLNSDGNDYEMNQEDCILKSLFKHFEKEPDVENEVKIISALFDLFAGGTDTVSTTLEWGVYFLRNHQNVQKLLKTEIAENVSSDYITISDISKLPLCHAFVLETIRFGAVVPASGPHLITKEFYAGQYIFPKGAILDISIFCMNRDCKVFKNPDCFDINNFLVDGKVEVPSEFMPFSVGPRGCIGERMARTEAFVFLANIVKKFRFSPINDSDYFDDNSSTYGVVRRPKHFSVNVN